MTPSQIQEWSQLQSRFISTMPDDVSNGFIGIFGLNNLGNTCFFNSILQNLAETRPLIRAMTASKTSDAIEFLQQQQQNKDQREAQSKNKNKGRNNEDSHSHSNHNRNSRGNPRGNRRYNAYSKKQDQDRAMDKKLRGRLLTEFHRVISSARSVVVGSSKASVVPSGLLNAVVAR